MESQVVNSTPTAAASESSSNSVIIHSKVAESTNLIISTAGVAEDRFSVFKLSLQLQLPVVHWYQGCNRVSYTRVEIENDFIQDDEKLFKDIHEMYAQNCGWLRQHFSIWRLERLEIVSV